MELRVLGCSGGVGPGRHTTAFLVDRDLLIDCGSGVGRLELEAMAAIRHVFLTHSHLDHIAFLPFLLDAVFERLETPVCVHALPETLEALRLHLFNWTLWPDFTALPEPGAPVVRLVPMQPGEGVEVGGRRVEMIRVAHTLPAVGYRVTAPSGRSFAFSGDSGPNDTFWRALNAGDRLDLLAVECAFPTAQRELARLSGHYCPPTLAADLEKLRHRPRILISHLKPGAEDIIFYECQGLIPQRPLERLRGDDVFQL